MENINRKIVIALSIIFLIGIISFKISNTKGEKVNDNISCKSISYNQLYLVEIIEVKQMIDRNFEVALTCLNSNKRCIIFISPDEGKPIGTEKILWSKNSKKFLLLGKNFFVKENCPKYKGNYLYLLYDIEKREIYCNSKQQSKYPIFCLDDFDINEFIVDKTKPLN